MNALLLPGNSSRHSQWIEELRTALAPHLDVVVAQHYQHWQTDTQWANIDDETAVAKQAMEGLDPYVIIGKSIGAVIATKAVVDGILCPQKLILLGVPLRGAVSGDDFRQWLNKITIPVVIVQNTADPFGSFGDIEKVCEGVSNTVSLVETKGATHDYVNFELLAKLL